METVADESTGHTPGPWITTCMDTYGAQNYDHNGGRIGPAKGGSQIAHVYSLYGGRTEANARLIAAAPDLLAACEYLEPILAEHVQYDNEDDGESGEAMGLRLIRAALALARGEAMAP